jgi:hypothetical protein
MEREAVACLAYTSAIVPPSLWPTSTASSLRSGKTCACESASADAATGARLVIEAASASRVVHDIAHQYRPLVRLAADVIRERVGASGARGKVHDL